MERHRRPSERAVQLGVALRETENLATAEWAAVALTALAGSFATAGRADTGPRLLRLDGDLVELVWDIPNPDVCAPWGTQDGGWSWTLERSSELRATDAPNPCPGLVTIGKRDGADVLLNLESCGAIAVTGDLESRASLVHSIALETRGECVLRFAHRADGWDGFDACRAGSCPSGERGGGAWVDEGSERLGDGAARAPPGSPRCSLCERDHDHRTATNR